MQYQDTKITKNVKDEKNIRQHVGKIRDYHNFGSHLETCYDFTAREDTDTYCHYELTGWHNTVPLAIQGVFYAKVYREQSKLPTW